MSNVSKVISEGKGEYHDVSHHDGHYQNWNKDELERVLIKFVEC